MRCNQPSIPFAGRCRQPQLPRIHARHIANTVGNAEASTRQALTDLPCHLRDLRIGGRRIFIRTARLLAEKGVPGQHGHIYRRAVPIHDIQIVRRMTRIIAAVSADRSRHAHAQHALENSFFLVGIERPVRFHGILVHMNVQKARAYNLTGRVDHAVRRRLRLCDGGDASILQQQIQLRLHAACRVDQQPVFDE